MKPTQDKYPVYEANQVLSNTHLNQAFDYLDEQERLTRANLIGIGIVCGLEIRLKNVKGVKTIHVTKGCGITSEGYLIVEPKDVALVSYRNYKVPNELDYPLFKNKNPEPHKQYDMWELFQTGESNPTLLGSDPSFLNGKKKYAVLLFLELKKEEPRNCSPNDCNDRGAEVTATLRRLLIGTDDLDKIIAKANASGTDPTFTELETSLLARLSLLDLRLPRYNMPTTDPVTSDQVLQAFHSVFSTGKLVSRTQAALTAAYKAFEPVVRGMYPSDPFSDPSAIFHQKFGFLDDDTLAAPTTTAQVRFLQYYYDFFDDILKAYDEFRWKGVALMCACCPAQDQFPRHLMLGVLPNVPVKPNVPVNDPDAYRHRFLASSAISGCEERTEELKQLFQRLVGMIDCFTCPPEVSADSKTDIQIRITPSKLADVPLSDKAIPYYYLQNGTPPLYQLWNTQKTRRNRANQNLSYRSDEYKPTAPVFVTDALRYDLEPYNFLRIEGHLGKRYDRVLETISSIKKQSHLPIEIIALRTGAFDKNMPVDLSKEECRFQELETLYDTLRTELTCFLCKEVQYFYGLYLEASSETKTPVQPKLPLLVKCAPGFLVKPLTLGWFFEIFLNTLPAEAVSDVGLDSTPSFLKSHSTAISQSNLIIFYVIFYISRLFAKLAQDLRQLNFAIFEQRYRNLVSMTELIERIREQSTDNIDGNTNLLNWEEIDDRLEAIIYHCRLDAFGALQEEYKRRIKEIKQKQFFSNFLQKNPGIQHKAGVPLGGTFIIVYHDDPEPAAQTETAFTLDTMAFSETPVAASPFALGPADKGVALAAFADTVAATKPVAADTAAATLVTGSLVDKNVLLDALAHIGIDHSAPAKNPATILPLADSQVDKIAMADTITRIGANPQFASDPDIRLLLDTFASRVPKLKFVLPPAGSGKANEIIQEAVKELADGTVIADFFLPYLCCSDCAPIQFVLPIPPLPLLVKIGCTDAEGTAEITITPQGGTAPFTYQLDNQPLLQQLTGKLVLSVGEHTLVIRDSAGAESTVQRLTVPAALTIGTETYTDNVDAMTYQVSFNISGGSAPYTAKTGTITGSTYTSPPVKSGTPITVTISDSAGCAIVQEFTHAICDLPCGGVALRCGYRFWMPEPDNRPYTSYGAEVPTFEFEFPEGAFVNLATEVNGIIQAKSEALNKDFNKVVQSWMNQINDLIDKKTGKPGWLRLEYKKSPADPIGTVWIEYFKCLKFEFYIQVSFQRPGASERFDIRYLPKGTLMTIGDLTTEIPAFNRIQISKCDPERPEVALCREVDLKLEIVKEPVGQSQFQLSARPSGQEKPLAFLWEVQDGMPVVSNKQQDTFTFTNLAQRVKAVRLTVFTEKGCAVTKVDSIELQNP